MKISGGERMHCPYWVLIVGGGSVVLHAVAGILDAVGGRSIHPSSSYLYRSWARMVCRKTG